MSAVCYVYCRTLRPSPKFVVLTKREMDTERNISEPSGWDFVLEKFNLGLTNIVHNNISKWSP